MLLGLDVGVDVSFKRSFLEKETSTKLSGTEKRKPNLHDPNNKN